MFKKIENKLNSNFSFKLITTLALICIIVIAIMFVTVCLYLQSKYKRVATECAGEGLSLACSAAENYFSSKSDIIKTISENSYIQKILDETSDISSDSVAQAVVNTAKNDDEAISSVWIIRDNDNTYISSEGSGTYNPGDSQWYSNILIGSNKRFYFCRRGIDTTDSCITVVYPIYSAGEISGYAGMDIKYTGFKSYFDLFEFPYDGELIICDSSDRVIYSKNGDAESRIFNNTEKFFVSKTKDTDTELTICMAIKYAMVKAQVKDEARLILSLYFIFLVIMIIAIIVTVKHECRSLPTISQIVTEMTAGNYNFRINDTSNNEIGAISQALDNLSEELQKKNAVIDDYLNLDGLTGAKNRVKLYESIDDMIISRDETRPGFAVVFFDIDNFRWINETLGHKYGDDVLKEFTSRLIECFGKVYRFSSDSFVILVEIKDSTAPVEEAVRRFNRYLDAPIKVLTSKLYIKCSEGAAIYPSDGQTSDALLSNAEIALSRSKERGKNRLSFFSYSLQNKISNKAAISQLLTHALDKGELYMNYQPIVSTTDRTLHGFEMLARWESEVLGFVPPYEFVRIAEETGEIIKIGMWIFETGCRFLSQLNKYNPEVIMSINVSAVQLKNSDFIDDVKRVVEITRVNPKNIQVEITETVLVDSDDRSEEFINEMHNMGFSIALDDFGTGYASLNYLKNFPINCLKVDKSFVDDIAHHGKDYKITDSIIDLVHGMGIKTVAEGVETMAQYKSIINLKCDYIQGFLMSKPMDEESALEFVKMYDEMYKPDNNKLISTANALAREKMKREKAQG